MLNWIFSDVPHSDCPTFLKLEIYGKPSTAYRQLPFKFNNHGQKINNKDSWVDNENEIAIWYGYSKINQGYGGWHIGPTRNIGKPLILMYSESYQPCPNEVKFWTYFGRKDQWIQASTDEIKVSILSEFKNLKRSIWIKKWI